MSAHNVCAGLHVSREMAIELWQVTLAGTAGETTLITMVKV